MDLKDIQCLYNSPEIIQIYNYLRCIGYESRNIAVSLGIDGDPHQLLSNPGICAVQHQIENDFTSELQVISSLFYFCRWIDKKTYGSLVRREARKILEKHSIIVEADSEFIKASVRIIDFNGYIIFSDKMFELCLDGLIPIEPAWNRVEPPNYSAMSLAKYAEDCIKPKTNRVLDVGCGTSALSLAYSSAANEIIAIDINERAIQFSRLNSKMNSKELQPLMADCITYKDRDMFDTILFNVPSVPKYRNNLVSVDTYTSKFGYQLVIDFINNNLKNLLKPDGVFIFWSIFALDKKNCSIELLLKNFLEGYSNYNYDIIIETQSPFALTEYQISSESIPFGCFLIESYSDRQEYLTFLKENNIVKIMPCIIKVSNSQNNKSGFKISEIDRIFPW